jgi:6-phosphogluconolactonase (cycloisomerase 2 family)
VNEQDPGGLQSFTYADGILSGPINTVDTGGASPAFAVGLSGGQVAVANYVGGNVRVIPTTEDGVAFDDTAVTLNIPLPTNESVSHPHEVVEYGDELLVPDLVGHVHYREKL